MTPALEDIRAKARGLDLSELPWWAREVRSLRQQAGLSIAQAAKKAGVNFKTWTDTEYGEHAPLVTTLEKILAAFGAELEIMQS